MEIRPRLLEHPFYQAWTAGDLSVDQLARYHRGYAHFIERFPAYWRSVIDRFSPGPAGDRVVQEERDHIELWDRWGAGFPLTTDSPDLTATLTAFDTMSPSRLLGAIHAFEAQQPEVARTKKDGLLRHYCVSPGVLSYFDAHMHEEPHIAFGLALASRHADPEEFADGVRKGAELVYHALDEFLP